MQASISPSFPSPSPTSSRFPNILMRKASATTIGRAYASAQYPSDSPMHLSTSQGYSTSLLYTVWMAARSVGAITPNSVTNSISFIHTLATSDGTATLPHPSTVIVVIPYYMVKRLFTFFSKTVHGVPFIIHDVVGGQILDVRERNTSPTSEQEEVSRQSEAGIVQLDCAQCPYFIFRKEATLLIVRVNVAHHKRASRYLAVGIASLNVHPVSNNDLEVYLLLQSV